MDYYPVSTEDELRFTGYRSNVGPFIQDIISAAIIDDADYVPGTQRIELYEQLMENASGFRVYDYKLTSPSANTGPYEEALYQRVASPLPGLLVLIGGLGSGKSTAVRHLFATIEGRRNDLAALYPCTCNPCVRRPIIVDCLDLDRTFTTNECEAEVMMRVRREVYRQIIDEWYLRNGEDPAQLRSEDRKVLRRLIIANDIYRWADSEALEFPAPLHTSALELPDDLLNYSPGDWNVSNLARDFSRAANALDGPIQDAISNIGLGKRFTALILGFWIRSCNPQSPNNLIVVDNLDQQPTDNIEQIVNHLHDLDVRHRGLRILLPLRPSSIVPHGFTKNTNYMHHYGPNCFDLIYKRLHKYVLARGRSELVAEFGHGRPFVITPSQGEITCFLVVTYIYALICINGLRLGFEDLDDVRPNVHEDHSYLHRIQFGGAATQQLADTLGAVVGTCGRYATDQLRRYFDHVYSHPSFLRQIEIAGLAKGASPRLGIPFGQIVSSVLGAHETEAGLTGLANLYSATRVRSNSKFPSIAKLRVLAFLSVRGRVRVREVIAALAQYGIPSEIAVDALNYLHAKNRLLLWFSRNTDLPSDIPDIDQYVVISEHGQAYLRDLVGDFEYVWFCARQILAIATSDNIRNFRTRLSDYGQLLADFARTEWKQMTFRRCSTATVWAVPSSDAKDEEEMLTLYILYSSLERALHSAAVAVRRRDTQYVMDVVSVIEALVDLILRRQVDYEVFYGGNGYLGTYALKIEKSRREVERLRKDGSFSSIADRLGELLDTWALPIEGSTEPLTTARFSVEGNNTGLQSDKAWIEFVNGIPSPALRPDEMHTCASLAAALGTLLARREALCNTLSARFPAFSFVDHELALLFEETKVALDAAGRLAAYTRPLLNWLEKDLAATADIREVLSANAFRTPDITPMQEMDGLKGRANNISTAYVALAQRLGVKRTTHLAIRWSI